MPTPSADKALQPGDIIGGRYRVIQAVGEGPLDRLYEAQDVHLHERVVVRVMRQNPPADEGRTRRFEKQARALGVAPGDRNIRVLELSRDDELGHFAAIANRENRPLPEVLALLSGVDGFEDPTPPTNGSGREFRFPSRQSQVELESLEPPTEPPASQKESPRYATPQRPKRLETLELDAPRISRSTGPRPAMALKRTVDWRRLLRTGGIAVVVLAVLGGGFWWWTQGGWNRKTARAPTEGPGRPTVMAPDREVQIVFQVKPQKARMRIHGELAPGHSILVPESDDAFEVRFEAPGHRPRTVKVTPDRNRTVRVALQPKP